MPSLFLAAVAREEGFGIPGGRATRNNNPGDINYGSFSIAHGADRIENPPLNRAQPRFAHFPTAEVGFAAMKALFQVPGKFVYIPATETEPASRHLVAGYAGATVREALYRYAPPADSNDTSSYEANVCKWVGCKPTDIIDTLL